jgi:argonaute-like protein implicated in RNA metabolism and viral defense
MVEIAGDHLEDLETIDTEVMEETVELQGGVVVQAEVAAVEEVEVEAEVAEAGAAAVVEDVEP